MILKAAAWTVYPALLAFLRFTRCVEQVRRSRRFLSTVALAPAQVDRNVRTGAKSPLKRRKRVDSGEHLRRFLELQRNRVHAVTQAGRLRSIFEHMTEMAAASSTENFRVRAEQ